MKRCSKEALRRIMLYVACYMDVVSEHKTCIVTIFAGTQTGTKIQSKRCRNRMKLRKEEMQKIKFSLLWWFYIIRKSRIPWDVLLNVLTKDIECPISDGSEILHSEKGLADKKTKSKVIIKGWLYKFKYHLDSALS